MKDNIIDITKILQAKKVSWADGIDILNSLEDKDAKAVVDFLLDYVSKEVEVGLGLAETSEDPGELQVFNRINSLYEKAAGGCYFCSDEIDPNEDEFGPEQAVCPMCKLKLGNFTEALGIQADKVFAGIPARPQKTKIDLGDSNGKTG